MYPDYYEQINKQKKYEESEKERLKYANRGPNLIDDIDLSDILNKQ